jgi:tyrosine-protein kinase Etk/Wzc
LGDLSQMIDQKSPAQSEIEILKSRLVLGSVIQALHLDLNISSTEDTLRNRLLKKPHYTTEYNPQSVIFKDNTKQFEVRDFLIPNQFIDKGLTLTFKNRNFF